MDANGTRHQLLLGEADWSRCADPDGIPVFAPESVAGVEWDGARHELTLRAEPLAIAPTPGEELLAPEDRRGADRDRFGNWYWIGPERETVLVRSAGSGRTSLFWPPPGAAPAAGCGAEFGPAGAPAAERPPRLAGLAVTDDHHLVVGSLERPGLLCFDLFGGGAPLELRWPAAVGFAPFDLCARGCGGVAVLDRERRRLWLLDRRLGVLAEAPASRPIAASDAIELAADDPVAVDEVADGSLLLLDRGGAGTGALVRVADGAEAGRVELADAAPGFHAGHDLALLPPPPGAGGEQICRAFLALDNGNQAIELAVRLLGGELTAELERRRAYPMRLFGGKALVAAGEAVHYDHGERFLPLVDHGRRRYERRGTLDSPPLDGREPGCVWHRLMLDTCLPPDGGIRVWSRAADDEAALARARWKAEPAPLRRPDSEIPYLRRRPGQRHATHELLFQRARGRHLQLRLELRGDGRTTPALRALRAYYPRFSYLERYLPAAYRDDPASACFLDRYLANLEGIATGIEDRIANFQATLDPRTVPAEQLEWLAGWLGLALDPEWDEARRRLVLAKAAELAQLRGTPRGLELALRLALDPCVEAADLDAPRRRPSRFRIVERFRSRATPGPLADDGGGGLSGPRAVEPADRWRPEQGAELLHERYGEQLVRAGLADPEAPPRFPPRAPQAQAERAAWRRFCETALGFVPAAEEADAPRWRAFLARRYATVETLNEAQGRIGAERADKFGDVPLPSELPAGGRALADWFQFEGVVLAMERSAHRFSVLIGVRVGAEPDPGERARATAVARRVVELEKPAQTSFDVKFFWSAFRLGEARLGDDTVVDLGIRAPGVLPGAVLGRDHLGESVLAAGPERAPVPLAARSAFDRRRLDPDRRPR